MRKRRLEPWPEPAAFGVIREKRKSAKGRTRWVRRLAIAIAVLLVGWLLCTQVLGFAIMQGDDMVPSILNGDLLVLNRLDTQPRAGDVIRFQEENTYRVGMIAAIAGDEVLLDGTGRLVVNGIPRTEQLPFPTYPIYGGVQFPFTVSSGCYFVLCANREIATDSRVFGEVSREQIEGKVILLIRRKGI